MEPSSNYGKLCNCAYTTSTGTPIKLSVAALLKVIGNLPKIPRILVMDLQLKEASILPDNTIIISTDIAEALEDAFREKDNG